MWSSEENSYELFLPYFGFIFFIFHPFTIQNAAILEKRKKRNAWNQRDISQTNEMCMNFVLGRLWVCHGDFFWEIRWIKISKLSGIFCLYAERSQRPLCKRNDKKACASSSSRVEDMWWSPFCINQSPNFFFCNIFFPRRYFCHTWMHANIQNILFLAPSLAVCMSGHYTWYLWNYIKYSIAWRLSLNIKYNLLMFCQADNDKSEPCPLSPCLETVMTRTRINIHLVCLYMCCLGWCLGTVERRLGKKKSSANIQTCFRMHINYISSHDLHIHTHTHTLHQCMWANSSQTLDKVEGAEGKCSSTDKSYVSKWYLFPSESLLWPLPPPSVPINNNNDDGDDKKN